MFFIELFALDGESEIKSVSVSVSAKKKDLQMQVLLFNDGCSLQA